MADDQASSESPKPTEKSPKQWQTYWQREIDKALKRLQKFHKRGNDITDRYIAENKRVASSSADAASADPMMRALNLFSTYVNTLKAMMYGQKPKTDVSREHQDPDDDNARVAALLLSRMLEAQTRPTHADSGELLKNSLSDFLITGLGQARVRYTFQAGSDDVVLWEDAPTEYVHWQDWLWGWCRTYDDLPWQAYRTYLDVDEFKERFGAGKMQGVEFKEQTPEENEGRDSDKDEHSVTKEAVVYEIWHKKTNKAFWYAPGAPEILDQKDDPLKLDGFWPSPKPLIANCATKLFMPTADYILAQDVYNQIDELYTRITMITQAVKVVGLYDQSMEANLGRMLKEGVENDMIPVDNWAMLMEKGGLQGVIGWFPVAEVVGTLQTLRSVLGEQLELLYEVTGMSDILRGANTQQYTSDGTNQLKAKFGSIRIQSMQEELARFASDLQSLRAEVIAKHFSVQSIAQQSSAQYIPAADRPRVGNAIALIKSPQLPWRVNIRPESIAMADYAQLKSERTEFMTAIATFLQSAQAMLGAAPEAAPLLLEMLKWGMAGFKGADVLEGTMDRAIDAANQALAQRAQGGQDVPESVQTERAKQQTIQMQQQGDQQKIITKAKADMAAIQAKMQAKIQEIMVDAQRDSALEDQQSQNRLIEMMQDFNNTMDTIAANLNSALTIEDAQAIADMAHGQQEHEHNLIEINAQQRGRNNG